jgi:hypothetical protein
MRLRAHEIAPEHHGISNEQVAHDPVSRIGLLLAYAPEMKSEFLSVLQLPAIAMKEVSSASDFQVFRGPAQTFPQFRRSAVSFGRLGIRVAAVQASHCDEAESYSY